MPGIAPTILAQCGEHRRRPQRGTPAGWLESAGATSCATWQRWGLDALSRVGPAMVEARFCVQTRSPS